MTKTNKIGKLAFFICGTPSDKRGFEYAELGPDPLPGNPLNYLDRRLATRKHFSYDIEIVSVGQSQVAVYAQSYPINPNDSEINRGAFLAVGFACTTTPSLHTATNWISHVGAIATNLRTKLKSNNTLPKGFRLKEFTYESLRSDLLTHQCSPLLRADLLLQATHRTGKFEHRDSFTFGDWNFPADSTISDHLLYTGSDEFAILALDMERERLAELAETATHAAALAASEQKNWLAFQKGTQRELEAFSDRKTDFDAVLERLQEQLQAAERIAEKGTTSNRVKNVHPANQPDNGRRQPRFARSDESNPRKPHQHSAHITPNRTIGLWSTNRGLLRKLPASSTAIAMIVVSIALFLTVVFFQSRVSVTFAPTAYNAETPEERPSIEEKPTFEDLRTTPDIVRERAALDEPSQSIASALERED